MGAQGRELEFSDIRRYLHTTLARSGLIQTSAVRRRWISRTIPGSTVEADL